MAKLVLVDISNFNSTALGQINANSARIEEAMEKTLSRDGTQPNQMQSDLDMNHHDILNAKAVFADQVFVDGQELGETTWIVGSGVPSNLIGNIGDMYLDANTGNIYGPKNNAGVWGVPSANILGPQGPAGPQGIRGFQGVQGVQGVQGIEGPEGPSGAQGIQGNSFTPDAIGLTVDRATYDGQVAGFSFLDSQTGTLYFKLSGTSGDWSNGITFTTGPQGPLGPQGLQGIQGIQGIQGVQGIEGTPGVGVPEGGTAGQVLAKIDTTDFNTTWVEPVSQVEFATKAIAEAWAPPVGAFPDYVRTAFYDANRVPGSGAQYNKVASEPAHAGKLKLNDGVTDQWYEICEERLNPCMFGAKRDTPGFDCHPAFNDCLLTIKAQTQNASFRYGGPIVVPAGQYELSQPLIIDMGGIALIGDGALTSVLKASDAFANAGSNQALVQHSPADLVGLMAGSQLKGIGLDCNHIPALKGYLGEMVYDQILYDDVRVSRLSGDAVGFHLRPKAGHALTVNQTIGIRDLFVAKTTRKGTVPAVFLEKCQEVYILGGKAWNGFGSDVDRGSQAAWYVQDCRSVVFVGTSFASSLWAGVVVEALTRRVDNVSIIDPLFENIVNPVRTVVTGANRIQNMRVVNPRYETPVTGTLDLDGLSRGHIEINNLPCTLGVNTSSTTIFADQLSQVTDNGSRNSIRSRRNAVDNWEGFGHNIRVKGISGVLLETSDPANGEGSLTVLFNSGGTMLARKVLIDTPDSGGAGFRQLRVAN